MLHKDKPPSGLETKASPFKSFKQESGKEDKSNEVGTISTNFSGTANVPVQKVKVHGSNGTALQALAMMDSGSNQSLIRKEFAEKLGLVGETKRMKMYVAGGGVKIEDSAEFDLNISPYFDDDISFNMTAYSVKKPCQGARTVSKKAVTRFLHLAHIVQDLHLSGGPVNILLGTDLPEAHHDFKVSTGNPGEPIAKKNIFG